MALVRIKDRGQVTLPAKLRESRGLRAGDYLDVQEEGDRIVLIPQAVASARPEIDAAIEGGLADLRAGRVTPAFNAMEDYKAWRSTPAGVEPFDRTSSYFFVGTGESGNQRLTKFRGGFKGYPEVVFERLVQSAGWLCQSSTFAIIHSKSLPGRLHRETQVGRSLPWSRPIRGPGVVRPHSV